MWLCLFFLHSSLPCEILCVWMEHLIVIGPFWHSVNKCVNILSLKCNMRVLFDNKRNNIQSALHYCKTQDLLRSILPLCTVRTGLYPLVNTKGQITSMTQWKHYFRNLQRNTRICAFQSICSSLSVTGTAVELCCLKSSCMPGAVAIFTSSW